MSVWIAHREHGIKGLLSYLYQELKVAGFTNITKNKYVANEVSVYIEINNIVAFDNQPNLAYMLLFCQFNFALSMIRFDTLIVLKCLIGFGNSFLSYNKRRF